MIWVKILNELWCILLFLTFHGAWKLLLWSSLYFSVPENVFSEHWSFIWCNFRGNIISEILLYLCQKIKYLYEGVHYLHLIDELSRKKYNWFIILIRDWFGRSCLGRGCFNQKKFMYWSVIYKILPTYLFYIPLCVFLYYRSLFYNFWNN